MWLLLGGIFDILDLIAYYIIELTLKAQRVSRGFCVFSF
jgi:hypothetical protein